MPMPPPQPIISWYPYIILFFLAFLSSNTLGSDAEVFQPRLQQSVCYTLFPVLKGIVQ
jgi:hypothetical protein